ncbi:hypothetical protein MHYP_G00344820 [Metynnis hypsauchen]
MYNVNITCRCPPVRLNTALPEETLPNRTMSCFIGDLNFCPECGNILPVPQVQDVITCPRCSFKIPVHEFNGQVIKSSVVFNSLVQSSSAIDSEEDSELKGPVVDRKCSRCNKEGMVYHTRQMRSADEGQTVFFTCIHCRHQEKEDSTIAACRRSSVDGLIPLLTPSRKCFP